MTTEERPNRPRRRPRKKSFQFNNQTLITLVCGLSVVLIVLLVIGFNINRPSDTNPTEDIQMNGTDATGTSETVSTEVTESTTLPATEPTEPPATEPARPANPTGGKYIDVGSGYIAEVIQNNVETFDGNTLDDYSRVTNNYLPKGTVDYCAEELVYRGSMSYVKLRCGLRVYDTKKIYPPVQKVPEVKRYEGTLPDHNEIGVVSLENQGSHTLLTLDCLWKAPFYFDIAPQKYANPDGGIDRSYAVTSMTATYVDITFCYATVFTGKVEIPSDNPLFKSAEIFENESDYTLRLHLRKQGGFYGWHAYYNDQDQLCFQFLNPAKVTAANNAYGVDLTGVRILIDVGHGGADGGAVGTDATGKQYTESQMNMKLALALQKELSGLGATVIFNRSGDTSLPINDRQENLTEISPDICIAVHQNSYTDANVSGFDSMYFTPFSKMLSQKITEHTKESGVYTKSIYSWSVNYFMCRQTVCPVVLTENGYLSNLTDLANMNDETAVLKKAQAITHGIADYFLAIN